MLERLPLNINRSNEDLLQSYSGQLLDDISQDKQDATNAVSNCEHFRRVEIIQTSDTAVQVKSGELFASCIQSDKPLDSLTSLPNSQFLNDICMLILKYFITLKLQVQLKFSTATPSFIKLVFAVICRGWTVRLLVWKHNP